MMVHLRCTIIPDAYSNMNICRSKSPTQAKGLKSFTSKQKPRKASRFQSHVAWQDTSKSKDIKEELRMESSDGGYKATRPDSWKENSHGESFRSFLVIVLYLRPSYI